MKEDRLVSVVGMRFDSVSDELLFQTGDIWMTLQRVLADDYAYDPRSLQWIIFRTRNGQWLMVTGPVPRWQWTRRSSHK